MSSQCLHSVVCFLGFSVIVDSLPEERMSGSFGFLRCHLKNDEWSLGMGYRGSNSF
jgi:hypothetical protein